MRDFTDVTCVTETAAHAHLWRETSSNSGINLDSFIIVTRGTGYETLQISKAITKVLQFMLKVLRLCTIFCFTLAAYYG